MQVSTALCTQLDSALLCPLSFSLSLFIGNKISEFTTSLPLSLFCQAGDLICTQLAAHNCFTFSRPCQELYCLYFRFFFFFLSSSASSSRLRPSGDCSSCSLCPSLSLSAFRLSIAPSVRYKACSVRVFSWKEKLLLLVDLLDWRTFMSKYCISLRREDTRTLKDAYSLLLQITVQWTSSIRRMFIFAVLLLLLFFLSSSPSQSILTNLHSLTAPFFSLSTASCVKCSSCSLGPMWTRVVSASQYTGTIDCHLNCSWLSMWPVIAQSPRCAW